jgi:parallel beta-helix repeat protein
MKINHRPVFLLLLAGMAICFSAKIKAQPFIHPGIAQTSMDLAFMKKMVLGGKQPWKSAFDRLKAATDTDFAVKAHTHVLRGPYGKPNIGGDDLSKDANMAYNYALMWYITNDKKYATSAINILNAWSSVLWDFDYNDAKLLAAWTGHLLCNAAEILRYTNSGWSQKDIDNFSNMLMTVYYPLIRYYYPQANGNWDGAIIHSILAIAIFTDNHKMFNNAVDHFLHAPVNGSIFKYIYPSGQCQESMRDQGHVQLGLGEFAGAAQIAFTQGADLFSLGDNRIALGYEYTAGFLLGKETQCYGTISQRAKTLRDDYEYVYRHYASQGVDLPNTKRAADSVRAKATRSVLTAFRAPLSGSVKNKGTPQQSHIGYIAGTGVSSSAIVPNNAVIVTQGQSVQDALNTASITSHWVMIKAGIHTLPATLKIPSGITISGEGLGTVLFLNPSSGERDAMVNADNDLHDVTIRDLVIEGSNKTDPGTDPNSNRSYRGGYNRGGIIFRALNEGQMKNIKLINLTVQNCTYNGVFISGAENITIDRCNFNENGGSVVPGPKLQHNLLLAHCTDVDIKDSRLDTSPYGSGIAMDHNHNVSVTNCEIARNGYYGVLISESKNVSIKNNLIEANDRSGVMVEFLHQGSEKISINNNKIQFNNGYGVESYAARNYKINNNIYAGNGNNISQQKPSNKKFIIME